MQYSRFSSAAITLYIASISVYLTLYTTQPLLPDLAKTFNLSESQSAQALNISTLMLGVSLFFFGSLSDIFGRRRIIVASAIGTLLTSLVLAFEVESFRALVFWRGVQGFMLGGIPATAIAYIGEEFTPSKVAGVIGLYISANAIGSISSRVVGGFVGSCAGWESVFLLISVVNCLALLLIWRYLPTSNYFVANRFNLPAILESFRCHLSNSKLWPAYFIGGLNFLVVLTLYSYVTFVLAEAPYFYSLTLLGLLFLTYLPGSFLSAFTSPIARYLSPAQRTLLGAVLIIFGTLVTLYPSDKTILLGLTVNGLGFFLSHSSLSHWINRYASHSKASASSLYLVFYYAGASAGFFVLNPFWSWSGYAGVVLGSVLIGCVGLLLALKLRRVELASNAK